jgi:hypothetical protein
MICRAGRVRAVVGETMTRATVRPVRDRISSGSARGTDDARHRPLAAEPLRTVFEPALRTVVTGREDEFAFDVWGRDGIPVAQATAVIQ